MNFIKTKSHLDLKSTGKIINVFLIASKYNSVPPKASDRKSNGKFYFIAYDVVHVKLVVASIARPFLLSISL